MIAVLCKFRWSLIAAQLPGRTDNEIKNYWNTRLKKKLRNQGLDPTTHLPVDSSGKQQQSDGTGEDTETVDGDDQAGYCSDASAAAMKANETTQTQSQPQQQPPAAAAKPNSNSKPRALLKAFQGEDGNMVLLKVPRSPPATSSATYPAAQHEHHALKLSDEDAEQSSSTDTIKSIGDHHIEDLQSSSRILNLRPLPEEFGGGDDNDNSSSPFYNHNNHNSISSNLSSNLSTMGLENHFNASDLCHSPQPAGNHHHHQQHADYHHQHPHQHHLVEDSEIPSNNNSSYGEGALYQNSGSRDLLDVAGGGSNNPNLSGGTLFPNPTVSSSYVTTSCIPPQPVDMGWQSMFGDIGQPSPGSFFGSLSTLPSWNYGQDVTQHSVPRVSQYIQRLEALLDQI